MSKADRFSTESELAQAVRNALEGEDWEVFPEVSLSQGGKRADLVAQKGRRIMIVETKLSLSLEVVSQALLWLGQAHHVVIAVPVPKRFDSSRLAFIMDYLRQKGIGLWWIRPAQLYMNGRDIQVCVKEATHRWADHNARRIADVLIPEMKSAVAGAKTGGDASTPFKRTCLRLRQFVAENPGTAFKAALESIEHHYSSVRSAQSSAEFIAQKAGLKFQGGRLYLLEGDEKTMAPPQQESGPGSPRRPRRTEREDWSIVYAQCDICKGIVFMTNSRWYYRRAFHGLLAKVEEIEGVSIRRASPGYTPNVVMCGCDGRQARLIA